jgi:hypothetical protein
VCNECNLKFKYKRFLPIYLHNLQGYDAHLFINALVKYGQQNQYNGITCIPNNQERYISFSKKIIVGSYVEDGVEKNIFYEIRFLDSLGFMASSLDKLAKNLGLKSKGVMHTEIEKLRECYPNTSEAYNNDEQFNLVIQKGVYPYDWFDKYEKMDFAELPTIEMFYSRLNKSGISEDEYKHAQHVWETFNCNTFKDYHMLYLKTDVLLLADVWQSFRKVCCDNYKLDACYYYTAPSLSWDFMLKFTKIQLALISDNDMFQMWESGLRGGISMITKRHAKVSKAEMDKPVLGREDNILYFDATNLYGLSMVDYLPYTGFQMISDIEQFTPERITNLVDECDDGYLFEFDIAYPKELHQLHNDYPLLPENIKVEDIYLNDWQTAHSDNKISKLCPNLMDKKNYVIHYRNLKYALQSGLKITRIHRVMTFKQKPFMRSYIMKNTELRKAAKNEFEKDFFKLMNNSCFGKTMENVRNRIEFKLISVEPTDKMKRKCKKWIPMGDTLIGIHMFKTKVILDKPIYVGASILDLSKLHMQKFHYDVVKPNLTLSCTDPHMWGTLKKPCTFFARIK